MSAIARNYYYIVVNYKELVYPVLFITRSTEIETKNFLQQLNHLNILASDTRIL